MNTDLTRYLLPAAAAALWIVVGLSDWRQRHVPGPTLLGLLLLALLGRTWPWWLLAGATILLPRRWSLVPTLIGLGLSTSSGDFAPGFALALGAWVWAMNWWGGADAIVLIALSLRHGAAGLIGGLLALLVIALGVIVKRRQSPAMLLIVLNEAGQFQPRSEPHVAGQSDLPAATVLAIVGLILEAGRLLT